MQLGYLSIETSLSHPGLIRLIADPQEPSISPSTVDGEPDPQVRYIARFNDLDAAQMHAYADLKYHLIDLESQLYRASVIDAIAVIEAIELPHRRVFLDPELQQSVGAEIERQAALIQHRHQMTDRIWMTVGAVALLWLLLLAVAPMLV